MSGVKFERTGSYWSLPLHRKIYLNVVYWLRGLWLFLRCLSNYRESVSGNDLTLLDAWALCFSIQEARMGKTFKMIFPDSDDIS